MTPKDFNEIYGLFEQELEHYLSFFIRNPEDLKDVKQQTFIKVYLNFHRFNPTRARFKTWLFQIGKYTALTYLRLNARLKRNVGLDKCKTCSWDYDGIDLDAALVALPLKYRNVILLRYREDLSCEEVARLLGIKLNTCRSLLFRAHRRIKKKLQE